MDPTPTPSESQYPFVKREQIVTRDKFIERQMLSSIGNLPEPRPRDPEELLALGRQAAELKDRIAQYGGDTMDELAASARLLAMRQELLWRIFPFNDLPVEIIVHIFRLAAFSLANAPGAFLLRFRLTWVCRYWREIAISDPTLWCTIWFKDAKIGYQRSALFLERAGTRTIDLRIEDDEKVRLVSNQPMTADDMERVLDIIMTKSNQIRMVIVVVEPWPAILALLDRLHKHSRSFQQLERIELHRTGRPYGWDGPNFPFNHYQHALTLCNGRTERINYICLNGIHIDWDNTYLANLVHLDLRRIPANLGPTLERFRTILESCPNLRKLSLDGAGPIPPSGPVLFHSYPPISLLRLESLLFGNFSVRYATYLIGHIQAPNLREISLMHIAGEDHTLLLRAMTGKFPELLIATLYGMEFPKNRVSNRVMVQWLLSIPKLKFIRVASMEAHMLACFYVDGRFHVKNEIPLFPTKEQVETIRANGSHIILCPELVAMEAQSISVESMVDFVRIRKTLGVPPRRLYVDRYWLEKMTPEEKAVLLTERYGPDFLIVTTTSRSMTQDELIIWKQVREGRMGLRA
ncbi:hypothetical protein BC827DRAFT_1263144 [Russula dissimulans]|nr:hypothetical protein BC827DRAFT_1263144 [Russula dissimulans]